VSDQTVTQVSSLTGGSSRASKNQLLTPYIFEEDLVSPDGGDAYLLFEILKASFVTKKYKETIEKLNQLIGTNISEETRNRAYFYLGQSQYFNHNYEDAVRSFVKVQAAYPTLAKKWLEASLDRI
jgi:TolA-binding protein